MLAAASAAALVAPAGAAPKAPVPKVKSSGPSPKVRAEIEKQKKSVADALAKIRGFHLPPGSDMAFAFRPLGRGRRR